MESPGPPLVISAIIPKVCEIPTNSVTSRKTVVGSRDGQVIVRNMRQRPAPSICAASYSCAGASCRAER